MSISMFRKIINKITKWWQGSHDWHLVVAVLTLALGVFGYFLVRGELEQLRYTNQLNEMNIRETYRPLGVCLYTAGDGLKLFVDFKPGDTPDEYSMKYDLKLVNKGKGAMVYIGSLSYACDKDYDMRTSLLAGELDSSQCLFDKFHSWARQMTIVEHDTLAVNRTIEIPQRKSSLELYVYTLFLYEDPQGNLYDTEHLDCFRLDKPTPANPQQVPTINQEHSGMRNKYHHYTREERLKLVQILPRLHPGMAQAISRDID